MCVCVCVRSFVSVCCACVSCQIVCRQRVCCHIILSRGTSISPGQPDRKVLIPVLLHIYTRYRVISILHKFFSRYLYFDKKASNAVCTSYTGTYVLVLRNDKSYRRATRYDMIRYLSHPSCSGGRGPLGVKAAANQSLAPKNPAPPADRGVLPVWGSFADAVPGVFSVLPGLPNAFEGVGSHADAARTTFLGKKKKRKGIDIM